jgi:hypothetical protein
MLFQGMAVKGTGPAPAGGNLFQNLNTKQGAKPLFGQQAATSEFNTNTEYRPPFGDPVPSTDVPAPEVAPSPVKTGFGFIKKAAPAPAPVPSQDLIGHGTYSTEETGGGFGYRSEPTAEQENVGFGLSSFQYQHEKPAEPEVPVPVEPAPAPKKGFGFIGKRAQAQAPVEPIPEPVQPTYSNDLLEYFHRPC